RFTPDRTASTIAKPGNLSRLSGSAPLEQADTLNPRALGLDGEGIVYFSEFPTAGIRIISLDDQVIRTGGFGVPSPTSFFKAPSGKMTAIASGTSTYYEVDALGRATKTADPNPFLPPGQIATYTPDGALYVSDGAGLYRHLGIGLNLVFEGGRSC